MTRITDLRPGDTVRGTVHACDHCARLFIARSDARYCSNSCRRMAHRKAQALDTNRNIV